MLVLTKLILSKPVMSLRTGRPVATAVEPIINPNNLKIEGFWCLDNREKNKQLVLVQPDIRDILPAGIVIDDYDKLADPEDLVRLQKVMNYRFGLLGMHVVTEHKKRIGKISDYATDPDTMYIQKLYVVQSIFQSFAGGSLSVDRSQIIEITPKKIVIKDPLKPVKSTEAAFEAAPAA